MYLYTLFYYLLYVQQLEENDSSAIDIIIEINAIINVFIIRFYWIKLRLLYNMYTHTRTYI